jgi:hypothetical protein
LNTKKTFALNGCFNIQRDCSCEMRTKRFA